MKREEHKIQCSIIEWCAWSHQNFPDIDLVFAVPNGGNRSLSEAVRFKREGVKAGMPDLVLPVSKLGFHSLYIEVKTPKGKLSKEQQKMHKRLRDAGNAVVIARSLDDFIDITKGYYSKHKKYESPSTRL